MSSLAVIKLFAPNTASVFPSEYCESMLRNWANRILSSPRLPMERNMVGCFDLNNAYVVVGVLGMGVVGFGLERGHDCVSCESW